VGTAGQQMTSVAVALEVYDLTGSSWAVGLTGLFQLVPLIVLGLYGGALIDRFDRRKVALIATVGLWASTLAFVLQSLAGADSVALLYAIIAVQSGFFAVANPARQAIVPRLVPLHLLPAANALNTLTWGLAFTIGPVIAGFLIAGTGTVSTVYLLDLVVFGIAVWAMWRLPSLPPEGVAPDAARGWRSVLEGIRFLKGKRNLQMSCYLDIVAMVFGDSVRRSTIGASSPAARAASTSRAFAASSASEPRVSASAAASNARFLVAVSARAMALAAARAALPTETM
jgi:MFS family permease